MISLSKSYDKIVVSNKENLYQSYMFYLFYSRFDPATYQKLGGTISGGYAETHQIGKIIFRPIDWNKDQFLKNTLFLANPGEIPSSVSMVESFNFLDGKLGVVVVKNN